MNGHLIAGKWAAIILGAVFACTLVPASIDLDRMEQLALSRYNASTAATVASWRQLIDEIEVLADEQKVARVNTFFNRLIRWRQDRDIWQQEDYWATPLETMARRQGDCEDFAVAKYMTLLLAGVDVDKMRITYVRAQVGGPHSNISQAHMVLAYYSVSSADPLILDNIVSEIRPASRREDLKPVFGFNSKGLWVGAADSPATNDPGARLSRWRNLLQRMAADGLG
ncbi:transglutaminase-like cysteine peptidase [Kineobactrum sediminis]|nr:transglutaminase-like cysteine peptidase [Kineobactrum sediminis]